MKTCHAIGLALSLIVAACTRPHSGTPLPSAWDASPELAAIDSMMWQRPDSALVMLLDYLSDDSSDSAGTVSTMCDVHYAQLLAAELLYKNDYEQTNRKELLQAVAYFDSLCPTQNDQSSHCHLIAGTDPLSLAQNDRIVFLDARAHYINGVGYYEHDSVVEACTEYIKALETMEGHFDEKELSGKKAKFMALTSTHLTGLFSDQYLHEQAIYFGKLSLTYYQKHDALPWHIAWVLNEIGSHYEIMDNFDSAYSYYQKSLMVLPDTNNLTYRDIATHLAALSYKTEGYSNASLYQLKILYSQSETTKEALSRCAIIGGIYYREKQYDSAWIYLNKVFQESQSINSKKQVAEWLVEICKIQDKNDEIIDYAEFLVPFATKDENTGTIKSQLAELYNNYKQNELKKQHAKSVKNQIKWSSIAFVCLFCVMLSFLVLYRKNKIKKKRLETQIKEEQYAHEMKQKALSGRLKQSNNALRMQKKETNQLPKELDIQRKRAEWSSYDAFMDEEICQSIVMALHGKQIKREAKNGDYPELCLNETQLHELNVAVEKHFHGFEKTLTDLYPRINRNTMNQCLLYLLNIEDVQIAALISCDYSTVKRRASKLKKAFNTEKELCQFFKEFVL